MAASENGYANQVIGVQFMKKLAETTKDLANGRPRLVHVDGHTSHISLELLENAVADNIIILGYPPHMTHLLQGLDVVSFNVLKASFHHQVKEFQRLHGKDIKKDNFIDLLIEPINKAFTTSNIEVAWRKTGLRPINPNIIPRQMLKGTSKLGRPNAFPTLPPSPIANLCKVFEQQVTKSAAMPLPPSISISAFIPEKTFATKNDLPDPLSLLNNRFGTMSLEDEHNPFLVPSVPQKAGTAALSLLSKLQGTQADFLMHPKSITSANQLPELPAYTIPRQMAAQLLHMPNPPSKEDWINLKNEFCTLVDRSSQLQAQVVLQTAHLQGLQNKLAEREKPKEVSNYRKVTGLEKNTVLTDLEVRNAIKMDKQKRQNVIDEREARKDRTQLNKEGAAWRKEATKRRKEAQAAQNAVWEADCQEARLLGMRKPQKPKAIARENTPTKYKKSKEGNRAVVEPEQIDSEEEEGSEFGNDDASYIGR